ncbi:hypothetical protein D3C81_1539380 [compost metagenome]
MEKADLAEHRADRRHLEEDPLQGLIARRRIGGQEAAGLLGQIDKDGPGFEQGQRLAARTVGINDSRDLAVGVQRQIVGRPGLVLTDVHQMRLIGQTQLLQQDGDLHAIGRRQGIELQPLGMQGRILSGDREGGQVGHQALRAG